MQSSIIINQSVQAGIETTLTKPVADQVYNQLAIDKLLTPYLIACDLSIDKTDNTRLRKQVIKCNETYDKIRLSYQKQGIVESQIHNYIKQIDIHANSNIHKSYGCSAYYIGEKGKVVAQKVYEALAAVTPWEDLGIYFNDKYYTLKKSVATNFILEVSFYDENTQLEWMRKNPFIIAQAIIQGFYNYFNIPQVTYTQAIKVLYQVGVLKNPMYWVQPDTQFNDAYFRRLIILGMVCLTDKPQTFLSAVHTALTLGLINSPDYWINNAGLYYPAYMITFITNLGAAILKKQYLIK